jgi:hypothetical protein
LVVAQHIACDARCVLADLRQVIDSQGNAIHRLRRFLERCHFQIGKLRDTAQASSRETDSGIDSPTDFIQQHEGITTTSATRATSCRTRGRGWSDQGRVFTGRDGALQSLDVGQLGRRCDRWCRLGTALGSDQQLLVEQQVGFAPQHEFARSDQVDIHRPACAGYHPLAGIQTIALDKQPAYAVLTDRESLTHNLPDGTDQLGHVALRIASAMNAIP